ncbi:apolipoprotein N-acyltransferase [Sphingomonas sp. RS6]
MFGRPLLVSFALGLLSATGFAPLDWWPVTLFCVAGFLALIHSAPGLRAALLRGWLFGLGHFTLGNNWIQHAFDYQDKMPPVLGYFAVVLLAVYLAVYPAIVGGAAWLFARRVKPRSGWVEPDLGYVLAAAAAWTITEWLRGVLFTGYPWNPLGVIWVPVPGVRNVATLVGTYALSGLTVAAAGTLYLASQRQYRAFAVAAAALLALHFGWSDRCDHIRCISTASGTEAVIVQPNIGQDAVSRPDYAEYVLSRMIALSGKPGPLPRLVVWPEGMVDYYVEDGYPPQWYRQDPRLVRARIAAMLGPYDRALIGGNALEFGRDDQLQGAGNSVWALGPDGMLGGRYDKAHLVPYGEYLPMRPLLAPLGLARLVMGDIDFLAGPGPRAIAVPGFGNAGIQICYEIIFSGQVVDQAHRPDFLFNPSNDAWFGRWGPPQHLAQARLRAIEEGLPILRSTPTGISALIDGHGGLLGTVPPNEAGAIRLPLPRPLPPTLFSRVGNWMVLLMAAALGLFAIANRRLSR